MSNQRSFTKTANLNEFRAVLSTGNSPFLPQHLTHIYIKLDFKHEFENARKPDDAKKFLRSIARAALAAHLLAESCDGWLLEVQGSMLHVALAGNSDLVESYIGELHQAYQVIFSDRTLRVDGWRFTVDAGKTLVVSGRGVHGDESFISLGSAANRPAKHLYQQLDLTEEDRDLKRFHVGVRQPATGFWHHRNMDYIPNRLAPETLSIREASKSFEPELDFIDAVSQRKVITAQAVPIGSPGTPSAPKPDNPHTYFGWVLRADLDGFTQRVESCFDNDTELMKLAIEFYGIMDAAAQFVELHNEKLVQLPWAGDNFTATAVFKNKSEYDEAIPRRLVELTLDFEKEMIDAANGSGFGGWAHGIAGGEIHGNANGNVYLAGVEVGGRRFLVGAGEGFGRSTQAFSDINPDPQSIVTYVPDYERLDDEYKMKFYACKNTQGKVSTLYKACNIDDLWLIRGKKATRVKIVSIPKSSGASHSIAVKPHYK